MIQNSDFQLKNLLKEYICNISNTNSLRKYVNTEISIIKESIKQYLPKIKDNVLKIKLNEVYNQIDKLKDGVLVKDNQIMSLLNTYELIKELETI